MTSSSTQHRIPLVDLAAQHAEIRTELDEAIARVMSTSQFILGAEVQAFEAAFAEYCGTSFAIGCGNGTDALELALWAVGVKPGDEVITVAHTFAATAEAIVRCGATPRFIDVVPDTLLMDLDQVEGAITERTTAIVPVHLYGSCVDMPRLMGIARGRGLKVVEDAAQAHGATTADGRRAGASGDAGCFSFYPGKNLGACGDAGAVVTSDPEVDDRVRRARDHGRSGKYEHQFVGRNSRMDGLQGAILAIKLRHLDRWNERRRAIAAIYRSHLHELSGAIDVLDAPRTGTPVYHLFVVRSAQRDRLGVLLADNGVATGIHYPLPLHMQEAFAVGSLTLPVTEAAAASIMSLPLYPQMSDEQVTFIMSEVGQLALAP